MKKTINQAGLSVFEFEDSEKEVSDKFYTAIVKSGSERYVIDRMIDGVCQSLLTDLKSGTLSLEDDAGLDVDSPSNVLNIATKFLTSLVFESVINKDNAWKIAHSAGLPDDGEWSFSSQMRQFCEEID